MFFISLFSNKYLFFPFTPISPYLAINILYIYFLPFFIINLKSSTEFFKIFIVSNISSSVLKQDKLNLIAPSISSLDKFIAFNTWLPFFLDEQAEPVETYISFCSK